MQYYSQNKVKLPPQSGTAQLHRPIHAPPLCPQPISGYLSGASVLNTSSRSFPAAAPSKESTPFGKRFPVVAPNPWESFEDRKVHPKAEKRLRWIASSRTKFCPLTILQMGKPEVQRRENPDQGHPEPRAEAQARVFSVAVGVQVRTLCGAQSMQELGAKARELTVLAKEIVTA